MTLEVLPRIIFVPVRLTGPVTVCVAALNVSVPLPACIVVLVTAPPSMMPAPLIVRSVRPFKRTVPDGVLPPWACINMLPELLIEGDVMLRLPSLLTTPPLEIENAEPPWLVLTLTVAPEVPVSALKSYVPAIKACVVLLPLVITMPMGLLDLNA